MRKSGTDSREHLRYSFFNGWEAPPHRCRGMHSLQGRTGGLVLVLGGLPHWGYHSYGYTPTGFGGVLLIILIVRLLTG